MGDKAGFIGVGNMGRAMAMRLVDAGVPLVVFDLIEENMKPLLEKGATKAASAREVADTAEIVFACLPALKISLQVAEEIKPGKAIKVYVETSTLGSTTVEQIAEILRSTSIGFLDGPVSAPGSGSVGALRNLLTMMVAGSKDAFDRAHPILSIIARNVFFLGEKPGMGQVAKLINNHIGRAGKIASYEGVAMGIKAGMDAKTLIDVINACSGRNDATMEKFPQKILPRRFAKNATMNNTFKDAKSFLEEAKKLNAPMWFAPYALDLYEEAAKNGYMNYDNHRVFEYVEKVAGIEGIRKTVERPPRKD